MRRQTYALEATISSTSKSSPSATEMTSSIKPAATLVSISLILNLCQYIISKFNLKHTDQQSKVVQLPNESIEAPLLQLPPSQSFQHPSQHY